jgi:hypothetical protein
LELTVSVWIFAIDANLAAIHLHDRPAFVMISNLERKLKFTMRPEASLVQVVEDYQATRPRKPGNIAFVFEDCRRFQPEWFSSC